MPLVERAPAKINLTLHVLGRRSDGYHELESLVVFTRSGDTLRLEPGDTLDLTVTGPTAGSAGHSDDNLVLRAARALGTRVPNLRVGTFTLDKQLPVAAGIGGGSSDAAAALRLLARVNSLTMDDPRVLEAALETGADVPVCLAAVARVMRGFGATLGPQIKLPPLPALLVNPRVPLETRAVFAKMGIEPSGTRTTSPHPDVGGTQTIDALHAALKRGRNDMEDAACVMAPIVSDVLAVLAAARGCKLARMSGSGATCFGLFTDCRTATRARHAIARAHPHWWSKAVMLA